MISLTLNCLLLKAAGFVLKLLWLAFGVGAYGALLFLGLCLNVFTVPVGLIACRGGRAVWRRYGLIFHPSWSWKEQRSFTEGFWKHWMPEKKERYYETWFFV